MRLQTLTDFAAPRFRLSRSAVHSLRNRALPFLAFLLLVPSFAAPQDSTNQASTVVDFDRDVRPILSNTCYKCHGPDSNKREVDLRFDQKSDLFAKRDGNTIVAPNKPNDSLLLQRVTSKDADLKMPPADQKQQLSSDQIATLTRWIEQGATFSNHWSFEVPQARPFPKVSNPKWPCNGVDHFVLAELDQQAMQPSPHANRATLLRRITLELTGLPPTLAELDAFLEDETPQAFEKLVDRLLASERFGEHFALPWLDAARYADSNGYQQDRTRTLWPWRDWVVNALNDNMPYDQFTVEQIAGDLLKNPTTNQLVATGFNRNHMLNGEGGRIAEESRVDYVVDRVETTAAVWLGLTVGCARCHDHKYDPISQKEFYQLYAYFNQIDESGRVDAGGNANPVIAVPTDAQKKGTADLNMQLVQLRERLKTLASSAAQQKWEQATAAKLKTKSPQVDWHVAKVKDMRSAQGQTLTLQADGSVLVTGKNPKNDDYTIELETDVASITGIRLEAIAHPSFTNKGLARSDSGNFVLTRFSVAAKPPGQESLAELKIAKAVADFQQGSLAIAGTLDTNPNTGWAVFNKADMTITRHAVYTFNKPLTAGAGTRLTVKLFHESAHLFHNIGRFRLAVTNLKTPKLSGSSNTDQRLAKALVKPANDRNPADKKFISEEFRKRDPKVAKLNAQIAKATKQLDAVSKQAVRTMVMRDRATPRETYVLVRGVWNAPDKSQQLQPTTLDCLPPLPQAAPKNRLTLANWLVANENPLTARVTVNRIWQQIFGRGLVPTIEDFGSQGDRPTHPQLLDWLATEFVKSKWNTKALVKTIVMSQTYQQSSKASAAQIERDRFNLLLGRGARFRLTAHAIRDQALALSGLLVEKLGGPPVRPYQPAGVWSDLSLGKIKYQRDSGENLYRRSLYTFWRRSVAPTSFFDVASRQVCKVRASRTNTPLHALTLLNDPTYVEAGRNFAQRVLKTDRKTAADRMQLAFRMATCRNPTDKETKQIQVVFDQVSAELKKNSTKVGQLLTIGESKADPTIEHVELAIYTTMMSLILNLDEVITKE